MVTLEDTSIRTKIAIYQAAKRRAVDYLLEQIGPNGEVRNELSRVTFYRLPWSLAVSGETEMAYRVLSHYERTGISAEGEFHGGVAWTPEINRDFATYPETCLAYGAFLLRRFDLAKTLMGFAGRFQDPETGGVFMDRMRTDEHGPQLIFLTAQYGMTAVLIGRVDLALKVGEWFSRLWQAQPELPERLYSVWTRAGGLAEAPQEGDFPLHYVQESQEVRQMHYNGGIAAAFLSHLYLATGEQRWIELARSYQRFSMESTPRQFEVKQVCKSAWGSGMIALATGDDAYIPWLTTMGDWFVAEQEAPGNWTNNRQYNPDPDIQLQIEITAEFIVHLDTVIAALSAVSR
jgi:hypothetical protein